MDTFVEQIVNRKRKPTDFIKVFLCLIAATIIITNMILNFSYGFWGTIWFFAGAALVYLLFLLGTSINLEFEYTFTNGALDVDKIIAARKRKSLTELNARHIEIMASTKNRAFKEYLNDSSIKKIYACTSVKDSSVYFVIYIRDNVKYMLLFNPNDAIKDGFRRLNPQKVFLDN